MRLTQEDKDTYRTKGVIIVNLETANIPSNHSLLHHAHLNRHTITPLSAAQAHPLTHPDQPRVTQSRAS